jgi:hypothetical protein
MTNLGAVNKTLNISMLEILAYPKHMVSALYLVITHRLWTYTDFSLSILRLHNPKMEGSYLHLAMASSTIN